MKFYIGLVLTVILLLGLQSTQLEAKKVQIENNIDSIHSLIRSGQVKCIDVIDYYIERSIRLNKQLNAIISFNVANAKLEALRQDEEYERNGGKLTGKLHCIPLLVKDIIDVAGMPTSGGIKALRYSIPNVDAPLVAKLKQQGAIVIGKTNLAELAYGTRYISEIGGACKNPYDLTRVCGASSSGSAAAVASGMAVLSLGTDTTGSIINPANYNALNGLRPMVGALNMSGVIPLFDIQDTVGPLANYVDDMVLAYSIMADDSSLYDKYKHLVANQQEIQLVQLGNFSENFKYNTTYLGTIDYYFNPKIKSSMDKFFREFDRLLVNKIPSLTFDAIEFKVIMDKIERVYLGSVNCLKSCVPSSFDKYFADANRFQSDAPYHTFKEFSSSTLLESYWQKFFLDVLSSPMGCDAQCASFIASLNDFKTTTDNWFKVTNASVLAYPPYTDIVPLLSDLNSSDASSPSFVFGLLVRMLISVLGNYASINVPLDFIQLDNGVRLPTGMMFMARDEQHLPHMFALSKLYEDSFKQRMPISLELPTIEFNTCDKPNSASYNRQFSVIWLVIISILVALI